MQRAPYKRRVVTETEDEGWLITFADMSVLLMSFFILMSALINVDAQQMNSIAKSLREKGFYDTVKPQTDPVEEMKKALTLAVVKKGYADFIVASDTQKGVDIELASNAFFESGTAKFSRSALPMLEVIAHEMVPLARIDVSVEIEGHTDSSPFSSEAFPSNWELSAARASNLVRYMIAQQFPAKKMKAIGVADTLPKTDEYDPAGNPIPSNQELNRRIVIHVNRGEDN